MIRIIDDVAYEGKAGANFRVRAHELGNGHLEISAIREIVWVEQDWSALAIQHYREALERHLAETEDERADKRLKIAANRAKTRVRRLCKAMGSDTLLTLTYRSNELDLSRVKIDLRRFNDRMERLLPEFRFVAAFERQERGAWHVHMATAGIPRVFKRLNSTGQKYEVKSFNVIRAVWRAVTGERGGNIDISRRKKSSASSPAKIASYLSKYMLKDFDAATKGVNRYAAYGDFNIPPVIDLGYVTSALHAAEVCNACCGDRVVFSQHYSHFGDWFFLHAEPGPRLTIA